MKNLFSIITNYDKNDLNISYEPFIIKKLTSGEANKIQNLTKKYEEIKIKSNPPKKIVSLNRLSFSIFVISFVFLLIDVLTLKDELSFFEVLKEDIYYSLTFLFGVIIYIICNIIISNYKKKYKENNLEQKIENAFIEILDYSEKCLGIPKDAYNIEVLSENIYIKKNKEKKSDCFNNVLLYFFKNKDNLYMADLNQLFSISLNEIIGLEKVDQIYKFKSWHKKTSIKDKSYEKYNIKYKGISYTCSYYYRLNFKHNNKEYYINIQPYDYEKITDLLFSK